MFLGAGSLSNALLERSFFIFTSSVKFYSLQKIYFFRILFNFRKIICVFRREMNFNWYFKYTFSPVCQYNKEVMCKNLELLEVSNGMGKLAVLSPLTYLKDWYYYHYLLLLYFTFLYLLHSSDSSRLQLRHPFETPAWQRGLKSINMSMNMR